MLEVLANICIVDIGSVCAVEDLNLVANSYLFICLCVCIWTLFGLFKYFFWNLFRLFYLDGVCILAPKINVQDWGMLGLSSFLSFLCVSLPLSVSLCLSLSHYLTHMLNILSDSSLFLFLSPNKMWRKTDCWNNPHKP